MMGSWSLGDYFKKERCQWSFELLTQLFGFDADHLAATVFAGDENAPRDEEGAKYRIESGFKPENIFYLPAEDNWWGLEYGPCGPDSEMFYVKDVPDCGPDCGPGCHCGKYTEIGNDVFMQYEKHHDGSLTPLSQKNVDTGWGLERILAFLNGVDDVYKIDLHAPVIAYIEKESGIKYEADEKTTRSMRILADHTRTSVMLIGDEAKLLPSNTGAGYILRRLIRRAVRHARTLGLNKDQILGVAQIYIDEYKDSYENLAKNEKFVLTELEREIVRFESTLENGMKEFKKILDKTSAAGNKKIEGKDAFFLYDTFGFPVELTVELAEEEGFTVDEEGFKVSMDEQKQKARDNQNFSANLEAGTGVFDSLSEDVKSEFVGYTNISCDGSVVAIASGDALADEIAAGAEGSIITDKTPFYGTMGGQVGDIGVIEGEGGSRFEVLETIHVAGGRTAHVGKVLSGSFKVGSNVSLKVDAENRAKTCRNHSATHLLQKALREVLGDHVEQAGSYQDPDKTRFDFSHHQAMTAEEIKKVEDLVNQKIAEALPVVTEEMSMEEAKKTGAMALFGEKYGDVVRVVKMGDFSIELCGGTHVSNTSHVGIFKIVSESGVAAGVRRIEALTGSNARDYYINVENTLDDAAKALKTNPADITVQIKKLQEELKALRSENESLKSKEAQAALGDVSDQVEEVNGVKILCAAIKGVDMNGLRDLGDQMKTKIGEGVVVLISEADGKVSLVTMATDGAMAKGAHAGNLVKAIAPKVGGGGGGRPNMAQAGGKNPAGISDAIAEAKKVLAEQIG
ncbi:MAG: alanine--tRNA ligase [Butyrivibrio sp.]|nr:alanine--tRNA ligase [Butyrivibrio sp.]